jgi:serine/threonine protein kinase
MSIADGKSFERLQKIGEGTYGVVFQARNRTTDKIVAVKIMKFDQEEDGIPPTTLREMSILRSISHPNIVSLEEVCIEPGQLMLVFEYVPHDLRRLLHPKCSPLDLRVVRSYSFQLLAGLYALHSHRIIHRDIKPDNLLLDDKGFLKICDFGLSRFFTIPMRQCSPNVVSLWYRAPELMFGLRFYDLAIDIWSAGCIIAEMICGTPLFPGDSDVDQLHQVFRQLGSPSEDERSSMGDLSGFPNYPSRLFADILKTTDPLLIDLVRKMLLYDPKKRISVQDALMHPFFNDVWPPIREVCWPAELADPLRTA